MHSGEFILSLANEFRSRENIVVASGQTLQPGTVIGFLTALSQPTAASGNTGNGTITVHGIGAGARVGNYSVVFTTTGATAAFTVRAPDGALVGTGAVGTRYTNGGIDITIADGAADWTAGDKLAFPVARGAAKAWDPGNSDGSETVGGIIIDYCDASAGAKRSAAVVRDATVNGRHLMWKSGLTAANKETGKTGLRALGIIPD
jgi:hypothetical protein